MSGADYSRSKGGEALGARLRRLSEKIDYAAERLLHLGYSERAVEKVLGGNFRRVFAETWT